MTLRVSLVDRVRQLAADYETENQAQVLSDSEVQILLAAARQSNGMVNLLDVAVEYVRSARYKAVDLTPERASAYRSRERRLLLMVMSPDYDSYTVTADQSLSLDGVNPGASLQQVDAAIARAVSPLPTKTDDKPLPTLVGRYPQDAVVGTSDEAPRADHQHTIPDTAFDSRIAPWARVGQSPPTSTGLEQAAVDARIETKAVLNVAALPTTVVQGQALLVDGSEHYWGYILAAVDSVGFNLTPGSAMAGDRLGFDRATGMGSLDADVPWIDRLWWNADHQRFGNWLFVPTPIRETLPNPGCRRKPAAVLLCQAEPAANPSSWRPARCGIII